MIEFEGLREFGGLYHNGGAEMRSKRPWLVDQAVVSPYDGLPDGDIPRFSDAPEWSYWRLGDIPDLIHARRCGWSSCSTSRPCASVRTGVFD